MICATQGREEFLIKKWISQLVHNTWKMRKGPLHHLSLQASVFYFCCCCCCCCCCCGENEGGIYFFSLRAGILLQLEEGLVRDEMARWQKKIKTVETNDLTFPSRKLFLLLLAWGRWRYSLQNCFSGLIYQPCLRRRVRQSIKKYHTSNGEAIPCSHLVVAVAIQFLYHQCREAVAMVRGSFWGPRFQPWHDWGAII